MHVGLLAKQLVVLAAPGFVGYLSSLFVIHAGISGPIVLGMLSVALTMLFTSGWHLSWIRSLRLPCWLVSFLASTVMYIGAVCHYSIASPSMSSISNFLIVGAICFVPAFIAWLVALSMMRQHVPPHQ